MNNHAPIRYIDGIAEGFLAVPLAVESAAPVIAVYHADDACDLAFTLPSLEWSACQINIVIKVYEKAYAGGERYGEAKTKRAMREFIGCLCN
ncbi:hypothetical protein [Burkholderia glumae]|uniref:Uncharacterized protein n=1 Tax=Burkholderia glumae TaxID=337 RepID=A0AAP9Y7J2_BURGL|nr:hypothetical protein [Burkholderia glumae]ACR32938.1 Hypothetical protein bglu_4p0620 [Burkholderia glumae BGR1]AJY62568.1 hypothetical protein KS03_5739 [Burkholderia glumae LMG 2196 = ATCC 33617]KHJ60813.1 hypothetical protein NCPPB3923_22075 [Burkholderia glumae]MCM2485684.1 hypothetical protein [Burkholderia glumae]MCM2496118.1 hypothetical protein [Burkholderia glumae]